MPPPKYKGHHNHRHQNKKGEGSGMGSHQAQAEMKQLFNSIDKQMDAYQEELMDNYFDFENPIYLLVISNDFLRYLRGLQTCSYYQHKRMDEILINNELIDSHKKPSSTFFWPDPKHAHLNYILSDRIGSKHLVVINEAIWEQLVEFGFKGHKIIQKFFRIYEGTKFSECFMYPEQEVSSVKIIEVPLFKEIESLDEEDLRPKYIQFEKETRLVDIIEMLREKAAADLGGSKASDIVSEYWALDQRKSARDQASMIFKQLESGAKTIEFYGFPVTNDFVEEKEIYPYSHLRDDHCLVISLNVICGDALISDISLKGVLLEFLEGDVLCEYCQKIFGRLDFFCKCRQRHYCSVYCKYKDISFHSRVCRKSREIEARDADHEFVKEASEGQPKGQVGLVNLTNSCYLNSVLQSLAHSRFMSQALGIILSSPQKTLEDYFPVPKRRFAYFFFKFFQMYWSGMIEHFECFVLKAALGVTNEIFLDFTQNDAHECLLAIIDAIESEKCLELNELLEKSLSGSTESSLLCPGCKKNSKTVERFTALTLPIPSKIPEYKMDFLLIAEDWKSVPDLASYTFTNEKEELGGLLDWVQKTKGVPLSRQFAAIINKNAVECDHWQLGKGSLLKEIFEKARKNSGVLAIYILKEDLKEEKTEQFFTISFVQSIKTFSGAVSTTSISVPRIFTMAKSQKSAGVYGFLLEKYAEMFLKEEVFTKVQDCLGEARAISIQPNEQEENHKEVQKKQPETKIISPQKKEQHTNSKKPGQTLPEKPNPKDQAPKPNSNSQVQAAPTKKEIPSPQKPQPLKKATKKKPRKWDEEKEDAELGEAIRQSLISQEEKPTDPIPKTEEKPEEAPIEEKPTNPEPKKENVVVSSSPTKPVQQTPQNKVTRTVYKKKTKKKSTWDDDEETAETREETKGTSASQIQVKEPETSIETKAKEERSEVTTENDPNWDTKNTNAPSGQKSIKPIWTFDELLIQHLWDDESTDPILKKQLESGHAIKLKSLSSSLRNLFKDSGLFTLNFKNQLSGPCPLCKSKVCARCQVSTSSEKPLPEFFRSESARLELQIGGFDGSVHRKEAMTGGNCPLLDDRGANSKKPLITETLITIEDCFKAYTEPEKFKCSDCKDTETMTKTISFKRLPGHLVVQLSRFQPFFNPQTLKTDHKKNVTPIQYKKTITLDGRVYELYSVINHEGELSSGHYYSFCRNSQDSKWYKFDDKTVSEATIEKEEETLSRFAYILFFRIKD